MVLVRLDGLGRRMLDENTQVGVDVLDDVHEHGRHLLRDECGRRGALRSFCEALEQVALLPYQLAFVWRLAAFATRALVGDPSYA